MPTAKDNSESIGRTPLIRINRLAKGLGATVLAKIEGRNPAYSVKCRIGAAMIWDAEEKGILKPGMKVVEPTSGNTGIAYAMIAAAQQIPVRLCIPDNVTSERKRILRAYGADLVVTNPLEGSDGAIRMALAPKGGPVVLAESSDSTGSGSPGDSTGVLKHLVRAKLAEPAAIFLVDPEAVVQLSAAGVGATVTLPIGGKLDRRNSRPIRVTGYVRLVSDGRWTPRARGYNTGIETCMGKAVVFEIGTVTS